MKKSVKTQNETTLEALVTPAAKQQADSLGIPLSSFIGRIATQADAMPTTIQIRMSDIKRINAIVGGGRIHQWLERIVDDALHAEDLNGNQITLDLPPETAARLKEAAEFEEVSVVDYICDGIRRDLDLTMEMINAEKN